MRFAITFLTVILFFSCKPDWSEADLLVYNAVVYTVDSDFSRAEAFAVKDGKFLETGLKSDLEKKYRFSEIYNAEGKTIIPGFFDAHAHLYGLGLSLQMVDLVGSESYDDVLARTLEFSKKNPSGFITGRGWDQNIWEDKEFPTKEKLDSLFPQTPVALRRIDGHALLVNSKAMELAGITSETVVPGGEVILENGEPSGVLIDAAMNLVNAILPPADKNLSIKALLDAEEVALSYGITTVDDAGLDRSVVELIDSLQQQGVMKLRVYAMISNTPENLDYYLDRGIIKTERLHVRSFKIFTDGALGSRGAAMRKSYSDRAGHYGLMITPPDSLEALARRIARSEYQMNSHAIGDSATIAVLRAYKKVLESEQDRRWRVEHAQIISPEGFEYFSADHNILASVQPTHATSDMYWAEDRLGPERIENAYAYKKLLNHSGLLALGTDFPVEHVSPFYTFYAAVERKDLNSYPENGFQIQDALSREEALKGMTIWAAFSNFEEAEKGSIEPGKLADFIVLDQDLMKAEAAKLPDIKVLATFINGEKVFEKN